MSKPKICIVSGTRADYGLLYWLMQNMRNDHEVELQIVVTGMHLSPEFGLTYKELEKDGFYINEKVDMLLSSDTAVGVTKSLGLGVIGFADAFERLKPDILVVLGDRFEILAAVQAALIAKIPVAHIAGGDTTEGAYDEAIRHSITKMSHLHFVTNEQAGKRVRQMGENQKYIFNVGSPGIDRIKRLKLMSKVELEESLKFRLREKNLLITFHPVTLDSQSSLEQFEQLVMALEQLGDQVGLIFTMPNADSHGRGIIRMVEEYVANHKNAIAYQSLGSIRYLSTISHVDAVVGNSSSGLYEVPSFKKPTVNIGDRQKGRLQATSVINCAPNQQDIYQAIQKAFQMECNHVINPYGEGDSSEKIISILKDFKDYRILLKKHFYEV